MSTFRVAVTTLSIEKKVVKQILKIVIVVHIFFGKKENSKIPKIKSPCFFGGGSSFWYSLHQNPGDFPGFVLDLYLWSRWEAKEDGSFLQTFGRPKWGTASFRLRGGVGSKVGCQPTYHPRMAKGWQVKMPRFLGVEILNGRQAC